MEALFPRFATPSLEDALEDSPVVLIHGARQCGKTTLAQQVGISRGYEYFSFDDDVVLVAAKDDPVGFVAALPERVILDEIQRVPELFTALKTTTDRKRIPGRFLLTGSANVLLLPTLSDSLAGRMAILRLYPLAQCEIERRRSKLIDALFAGDFKLRRYERLGRELADRVASGGYPAALARPTGRRRVAWYRDYVETIVQRDVRLLSQISSLDVLPRLLALAATQTARLLNASELASPFQLSRPTIRNYVTLLEHVFLIEELPPWHSNRLSRLIKTPKLHLGDTGIACQLLGVDADALDSDRPLFGQLLETFVYQELRRLGSWHDHELRFHHFRDKDGAEVDVVIERGTRELIGIEVKASSTVKPEDFRGLNKLKSAAASRFAAGVVFYDGEASVRLGEKLFALPLRMLWES